MKFDSNKTAPVKRPALSDPLATRLEQPERLMALLLALITVMVYLPAGFHDFTNFDDTDYVSENLVVQNGLTWAGFKWAFIGWHSSNWHPLTWLSHELDCQLFGLNAGAHHLVNVLFHAANTVLLFQLWRRLTKACWPSAVVAALFAWHPLHVESVAWVAERKDVLSTFFGLLALLFYARYAQGREAGSRGQRAVVREQWSESSGQKSEEAPRSFLFPLFRFPLSAFLCLSLLCFALGLLAKPMLVTLPCVLLLLDYWPLQRFPAGRWQLRQCGRLIGEKWPFFLLAAAACVLTWLAQRDSAIRSLGVYPFPLRLENAVTAYASYVGKVFWPVNLCALYPLPTHFSAGHVLLAATVLAAGSLAAWRWRQHRYFVVGWLWFLGMLVPVIGLVQVGGQSMADRYTYLPVVGLFVAVVFGMAEAQARGAVATRSVVWVTALLLAACVGGTEYQLHFWHNSETLFTRALAVTRDNGQAHMMLGLAYEKQGRDDEARKEYYKALSLFDAVMVEVEGGEIRPLSAQVRLLLGQSAEQKHQVEDAIACYAEALRLDPNIVEAHNNLGNLLDDLGRSDEALAEYRAAVRLRPANALVHENLGTQLAKMGRLEEAMSQYQEAARLAPKDPHPIYLMGKAWLRHGQSARAVSSFQKALELNPDDYPSLVYLARVLAADESSQIRNGTQAVALAETADKLTGGTQPFVLGTLAMAYAETGRIAEARKIAQAALNLAAGASPETISNLQAQLLLYNANRPFRDSFTNQAAH